MTVLDGSGIVETIYSGEVTVKELFTAAAETYRTAQINGKNRLLADCRDLGGGHSAVDLARIANELKQNEIYHSVKEAILAPSNGEALQLVMIWITICETLGIDVKLFTEREQALNWLMKGSVIRM